MLGTACLGAAQVIMLTDRPVPSQLANMESVLMSCLVCLGPEASHFCVMHTLDTFQYSATPLSPSPGDTVFLPVEKHWMLPTLSPGINFFLPYHSPIRKMHHSCRTIGVGSANIYIRPV